MPQIFVPVPTHPALSRTPAGSSGLWIGRLLYDPSDTRVTGRDDFIRSCGPEEGWADPFPVTWKKKRLLGQPCALVCDF